MVEGKNRRTNTDLGQLQAQEAGKSVFLLANASVYSSEDSHKATSDADLTSRFGPPGICRSTGPSS